ncbi:MAG: ComEA family DNA-binding protein [Deltaproteobacteria bacterium]|nr:ComEA family DNA-binding protein [Deltaproteobacteria bacterium]MBW2070232.1 ComEA family DNA-binding protein [Deltaproteobacteria bacterium]
MTKTHTRLFSLVLVICFCTVLWSGTICAQEQEKININTATVEQLSTLKRIGPSYAQRIVEYRAAHGPFQKPEDIMQVKGIGMRTYEENKELITCE